jgi:opacity protein-like surface antigen
MLAHRRILFVSWVVGLLWYGPASADGLGELKPHYLRLDLGYAWQDVDAFSQDGLFRNGGGFTEEDFGDSFIAGAGIGWRLNPSIRFDLTGEYRFKADVDARDFLQITTPAIDVAASTAYSGEYSAIVALANLYIDLPKIHETITPYVGAGIGLAHNRFSRFETLTTGTFTDLGTGATSDISNPGFAGSKHTTEFAWALMAGASIELDERRSLDIGYRFMDLGGDNSASTSLIDCVCGAAGGPLSVSDLRSHDLRIGLRWQFEERRELVPLK